MITQNRKRDTFINWLKTLKHDLSNEATIVLVEGKRDKQTLEYFGIPQKQILMIAGLSEESLKIHLSNWKRCIPLVDFDRHGKKYLKFLKRFESLIEIDQYHRRELAFILQGRYREIEDLIYYAENLRLSQEEFTNIYQI